MKGSALPFRYQPSRRPAAAHFPRPPQQAEGAWFAHRRNSGRAWGLLWPGWPRQLKAVAVPTQLFWGLGVSQLYTWRLCVCTGCNKHQSSLRGFGLPEENGTGVSCLPGSGVALYPWHCLLPCRPPHGSNSTWVVKAKMRQCHERGVCTVPVSLQRRRGSPGLALHSLPSSALESSGLTSALPAEIADLL